MHWLLATAAGLAALGGALWTAPRWFVPRLAAHSARCLYRVPTAERALALTFDDGPDTASTLEILRLLRAHNACATFFPIADRVQGRESLLAAVVDQGHELGNHLTHDEPAILLTREAFEIAVREAGTILRPFGPVRWLRPGSGWYNAAMLDVIEREGYRCALGSVYPYDAHVASVRFAAAYILANARPGAVIVLHEDGFRGRRTVDVLQRVLPVLSARGYRVLTLTGLDALTMRSSRIPSGTNRTDPKTLTRR